MKLFLSAVVLLAGFSINASAMPAIGDYVMYNINLSQGGQTYVMTIEQEITAAHDNMFDITQTTTPPTGAKQVKVLTTKAEDMITDNTVATIMTNCAGVQGQMVEVNSAALGKIQACRVTETTATQVSVIAIYPVPFGVVQMATQTANGSFTADVASFHFGKKQ
jgi:hypothetical protein